MSGFIPDDVDTTFHMQHFDDRDIKTINKHLADQRKQLMGEDEKLFTAADIHFDVLHKKEDKI